MPLNGTQMQQLTDALSDAYTADTLAQMLRFQLERKLEALVNDADPLKTMVFKLIEVAEREEWTYQLVTAAHQYNPGNAELRAFYEKYAAHAPQPTPPSGPLSAAPADHLDWLRRLGAKNWQLLVVLIWPLVGLVWMGLEFGRLVEEPRRFWAAAGALAGLTVCSFVIVRFPRVTIGVTRLIVGQPKPVRPPGVIFRGPRPYKEGDRRVFHGRDSDIEKCWHVIREPEAPFIVIDGETGCGKSSLLSAGILPFARQEFHVVECRVRSDPVGNLRDALSKVVPAVGAKDLPDAMAKATVALPDKPLLLCLDQFEELFAVKDEVREEFLKFLEGAIAAERVRVVIGIRRDYLPFLVDLCRTLDPEGKTLDLGKYYTVRAFHQSQAEEVLDALFRPLHQNDPLKKQPLDDLRDSLVRQLLRPPRDPRLSREDRPTVLPVELQIVGMMIEELGLEGFSATQVRRLGGKPGLIRRYLERAADPRKTGLPEDLGLKVLRQLVSAEGRRQTRTPQEMAQGLGITPRQAEQALDAFAEQYLVNKLPSAASPGVTGQPSAPRYELMHDYLANILEEAPNLTLQRARVAEERLRFWVKEDRARSEVIDQTRPSWLRLVKQVFSQPVPLGQVLLLWKYAAAREWRSVLSRSLRGFAIRLLIVLVVLAVPGAVLIRPEIARRAALQAIEDNDGSVRGDKVVFENAQMESLVNISPHLRTLGLRKLSLRSCPKLENLDGLEGLTALTDLELVRCRGLQNVDGLKGLTGLKSLNFTWSTGLQNVEVLKGLTALTDIDFTECWGLRNVDGLKGLTGLKSLNLTACTGLQNVDGLKGLASLKSLNLAGCVSLQNVDGLEGLTALTNLNLNGCQSLENVEVLKELTSLESLYLNNCEVLQNVEALKGLTHLTLLELAGCRNLQNVEGLQGLTGLKHLNLNLYGYTGLQNVEALKGLTRLTLLNLAGCPSPQIPEVLKGLTGLTGLSLQGCTGLQNVDGLKGLTSLTGLDLTGCTELQNVDGLKGLIALTNLSLNSCRRLRNVDGLKGLTTLEFMSLYGCEGLQNVDGLEGLTGLKGLDLTGCTSLQNVDGLKGLTGLDTLNLTWCTKLREQQIKELRSALPRTNIVFYRISPSPRPRASRPGSRTEQLRPVDRALAHLDFPFRRPPPVLETIDPLGGSPPAKAVSRRDGAGCLSPCCATVNGPRTGALG